VTGEPSPWSARRERAHELRARHPFVAEVLTLYLALLDVQEDAWSAARDSPPHAAELCEWAAAEVVPRVVEATAAAGPAALAQAVRGRAAEEALAGWLDGAQLDPVDRYLARASLGPVLEALGQRAGLEHGDGDGHGESGERCPHCGGLPQVAYLAASGEALVTGRRSLSCSRCGSSWSCSRSACPACGEADEAQLVVYAERWQGNGDGRPVFPHLRVAGCTTCKRYLIDVDLERDAHAVPEVDELAALPLDLYAADQGLTKLTANLMGF
jgi:FdhE protein